MQRELVLLGVDANGADAEFVGRADDADGDLATVGDEQFADALFPGHVDASRPVAGPRVVSG
jgi:hypothetical protein